MTRRLALTLGLLLALGGIAMAAFSPVLEGGDKLWPLAWLLWAPVGYLILLSRPGNGVGAALYVIGIGWGLGFLALAIGVALPSGTAAAWAEMIQLTLGVLPWISIAWLLLVFPTGRLEGRGERVVTAVLIVVGTVISMAFAFSTKPMESTGLPSPLRIPAVASLAAALTADTSFIAIVLILISSLVLLIRRFRKSTGVERAQYRWLLMGALIFVVIVSAGQFFPDDSPADFLWLVGASAIPVSIGVAVLRYRLFEIDRLVSRTLSYLVVAAVLAAVFFGAVTAVGSMLASDSDLVTAAATLAVAGLFNPVRRRVQLVVDRRFNRARYDAQKVMDRFAGSLQGRVDGHQVISGWTSVVTETMQPSTVGVWVREAGS